MNAHSTDISFILLIFFLLILCCLSFLSSCNKGANSKYYKHSFMTKLWKAKKVSPLLSQNKQTNQKSSKPTPPNNNKSPNRNSKKLWGCIVWHRLFFSVEVKIPVGYTGALSLAWCWMSNNSWERLQRTETNAFQQFSVLKRFCFTENR